LSISLSLSLSLSLSPSLPLSLTHSHTHTLPPQTIPSLSLHSASSPDPLVLPIALLVFTQQATSVSLLPSRLCLSASLRSLYLCFPPVSLLPSVPLLSSRLSASLCLSAFLPSLS